MKYSLMLVVALVGCASEDSSAVYWSLPIEVIGPVAAGQTTHAIFRNTSENVVNVGSFGCRAGIDRQIGGSWVAVSGEGVCPAVGREINPGQKLPFTFLAPTTPGTYRMHIDVSVVTDDPPGQSTLQLIMTGAASQEFVVR